MNSKFTGANIHRTETNPKERVFANAWQEQNKWKYSMLEQLLSADSSKTPAQVSLRDEMIAVTVIQWLGSPVGLCFLRDVLAEIEDNT